MPDITPQERLRNFVSRVLAWPSDNEPGYGNIHNTTTMIHPKSGKPLWSGKPTRTVDQFINQVNWAVGSDKVRDIYFCLSLQKDVETKVTSKGKKFNIALRNQLNALNIKNFVLDIDFKGGDHGYNTKAEALMELYRFVKEVKLPAPSILVGSGGGVHVYWIVDRALTPAEWSPVAFQLAEATKQHNLKCDTQCTVDIARVLRVPGTFNMKQDQPRPVTVLLDSGPDYPLAALASPLQGYIALGGTPTLLPKRNPVAGLSDLAAGIDSINDVPIDLKTVVPECPFIKSALMTGGKNLSNPLWNMTTLLATFTGNGRTNAHLMARGHPGYMHQTTDDLYDRKVRDKEAKGLGWPGCSTIHTYGAKECALCPHNIENKSPLNFGDRISQVAPVKGAAPVANSAVEVPTIPHGYTQRSDGVMLYMKDFGDGKKEWVPVTKYVMTKPWLQREPWIFNFTTKSELGREHQIAIELASVDGQDMRKVLQSQGFTIENLDELKRIGKLIMSWVSHLQNMKGGVISSHPFGWDIKNGHLNGFIYGGMKHSPSGMTPSANPDPVIQGQYAPSGERQPWVAAASMITSQGKPEFDAIIASAFAAPLVFFTGQSGMLMSCYSIPSGVGKSTALRVAQAVWGDPVRAMQSLSDTQNSVIHKIGEIRALPLYWDELKTEQDAKKFANIAFTIPQGKEKSRLTARASQRSPGTWQTLLVSASNESLVDIVEQSTKATTAGIYRIFEYEIKEERGKWSVDPSDAQRIVSKLNNNYGQIGLEYAAFCGVNFPRLEQEVAILNRALNVETNTIADERFWLATITVILMGAKYANELGFTNINEERLKFFLLQTLESMRAIRGASHTDFKNSSNLSDVMAQFFSSMQAKHVLYTNICRTGVGRPTPGTVKPVRATDRLEGVSIRVGAQDKIIRISTAALSKWLLDAGYPKHVTVESLKDKYGAARIKGRIGSGTDFSGPQEWLLEIDLMQAKELNFIDEA